LTREKKGTGTINDDDYFTAESSEDETTTPSSRPARREDRDPRCNVQSLRSNHTSFMSIVEQEDLMGLNRAASKESLLTTTLVEDCATTGGNLDETREDATAVGNESGMFERFTDDVDSEMTLKFDIQRPILGNVRFEKIFF
jgi:hypothetical protein